MRVWRAITAIITLLVALFGLALPVSAHEFRSDKGIAVVLHVPPVDKPLAAQVTNLQFTFENFPATFSIVKCGCQVQITGSGSPMTLPTVSDPSFKDRLTSNVTFPRPGEYVVRLMGYMTTKQVNSFSIPYDVHVYPASIRPDPSKRAIGWRLIGLCAVTAIIVLAYYYRPEHTSKK